MSFFGPRPPPHRLVDIAMVISRRHRGLASKSVLYILLLKGQYDVLTYIARVCMWAMLIECWSSHSTIAEDHLAVNLSPDHRSH